MKKILVSFCFTNNNRLQMSTTTSDIEVVNFGVFSAKEILQMSEVEVFVSRTMNGPNSIYDERMGVSTESSGKNCVTCGLDVKACPGHPGHIVLNEPIVHPASKYSKMVINVLKCFCVKCHKILISKEQLLLSGLSKFKRETRMEKIIEKLKKQECCFACGSSQPKIVHSNVDDTIHTIYKSKGGDGADIPLTTREILALFDKLSDEDVETLGFNPKMVHPRNFILTHLLVLPPCARPIVITDSNTCDDDLTNQYIDIIKLNQKLDGQEDESLRQKIVQQLKFRIQTLFDNRQNKAKHTISGKPIKGIIDRITGKEGQIRKYLMGKRCEQTARTVIGPEPTLRLGQLGVPLEICANLTYPEYVNEMNIDLMNRLLDEGKINGVFRKGDEKRLNVKYAAWTRGTELLYKDVIVRGSQKILYINQKDLCLLPNDKIIRNGEQIDVILPKRKDFRLNIGDKVERQLQRGDIVLLNRQPTLHKGSMMAHEVVPLPCKTLRFNLSATKSFNADFDGDEMNIHIPQSPEAMSELKFLSSVKEMIITPQSSKPNIQIVQDSLLAGYRMTTSFCEKLTKGEFYNIANRGINVDGSPMDIAFILKKVKDYQEIMKQQGKDAYPFTGKSLFSLCLPVDFNYENKNDGSVDEPVVKIKKGILYEGTLNKSDLGNMMVHAIYKEYGNDVVATFIDNVQFLTSQWLLVAGFSVGIEDCIATKSEEIANVIERCFLEAKGVEETTYHEGIKEVRVNASLSKARDIGLRIAKSALDPKNNFLSTVNSGSKGDFFNIAQITGLLGQQNLTGQRIPKHLNKGKRTLPHYPMDDSQPFPKEMEYESRGFIRHSFIHGLNPQEFYFHAMTGREGVTDTAMGTSKSGYMQRRIVKVLEDIMVKYDNTVRNSEGNIIQFSYGDDGLDPSEVIFKKGEAQICDVSKLIEKLNAENM